MAFLLCPPYKGGIHLTAILNKSSMNNQSNFQQEDTDFSAFRASDWTAMQVLLDAEETKKPFLFWLFGGLSIAAILVYFLFLNAIPQVETPKIAAKSAIMPVDVCTENGDFSRNKRTTAAQVERRAAFVFSNNKQTRNEESENMKSARITNENITNENDENANEILEHLRTEKGIIGGLALSKYYADNPNDFLVCVTETNTKAQIDSLVEGLKNVVK